MAKKRKNEVRLIDALSASRQLCEEIDKEENEMVCVPIDLVEDNGDIKRYISLLICKKDEEVEAKTTLRKCVGMTKDEYIESNPYHHISTFRVEDAGREYASFDLNDDNPVKIELKEEDVILRDFFQKFNRFRNSTIENNEILKDDDIYQLLYIYRMGIKKARGEKVGFFQKIKQAFSGN